MAFSELLKGSQHRKHWLPLGPAEKDLIKSAEPHYLAAPENVLIITKSKNVMKKYWVYQYKSEPSGEMSNKRSISLERVEGPEPKFPKNLDQKIPGANDMLRQMEKKLMTAGFETEQEAKDYINQLEREEDIKNLRRFCIVNFA